MDNTDSQQNFIEALGDSYNKLNALNSRRWIRIHKVLWARDTLCPDDGAFLWKQNGEHTFWGNSDINTSYKRDFMIMNETITNNNGKFMKAQFVASTTNLGDSCRRHKKKLQIDFSCVGINFETSLTDMVRTYTSHQVTVNQDQTVILECKSK